MADTNLKVITNLCRDIHTICSKGTPAVMVAAKIGLQDLLEKLTNLPTRITSPTQAPNPSVPSIQLNGNPKTDSPKKPHPSNATKSTLGAEGEIGEHLLRPRSANPQLVPFKALSKQELGQISKYFEKKTVPADQTLFSYGQERSHFYIIEKGNVEKSKIVWGKQVKLITLGPNDTMGEEGFLDKTTHSATAVTKTECTLWLLSLENFDKIVEENPKLAIKMMKNAANVMRHRLMYPGKAYIAVEDFAKRSETRIEHDSIGNFELPGQAYYGVQTGRAIENFPITGIKLSQFPRFIEALCYIKKAAAITNSRLGELPETKKEAICSACDEILEGRLHGHFVVDMVQGGAGTSTNMNANEVIANRALEIMGKKKGEYDFLHPNNDVNLAQSTNDVYPSAIHVAALLSVPSLDECLKNLADSLASKGREFSNVLKMGRTQLQDAVPMTLGQEFEAWAQMIRDERLRIKAAAEIMEEINMGATAIGTGLNAHPAYSGLVVHELRQLTGLNLRASPNLIMATQDTSAFLNFSSVLKNTAARISKICNDLRLLSSGPRCGLGEINLPGVQPGSSIMPGKINPVIPEVMNQTAFFIIGADTANTFASEAGQMELNAMEPLMGFLIFLSIDMMKNAIDTLIRNCINGIQANEERCKNYVINSIGIVTALNPFIGYENAARIAKLALKTNGSVYELVLKEKLLTKEQLDEIMQPDKMTKPRDLSKSKAAWKKLREVVDLAVVAKKAAELEKQEQNGH